MGEDIPEWAKKRRNELTKLHEHPNAFGVCASTELWDYVGALEREFARYIAQHEEPPVDPLWAEAMAFTSARGWNGDSPVLPMVKFAKAAMERGIELAREQS